MWTKAKAGVRLGLYGMLLGLVLGLAGGCGSGSGRAPIPPAQLAQVMADMSVAEAATQGLSGYPKDSLLHAYFEQVYVRHGITLADLETAMRYYAEDLEVMREILQQAQRLVDSTAAAPN